MKEIQTNETTRFQCEECKMVYKEADWAGKCEAWCKENESCNLDIIAHAEKDEGA